MFPSLGLRWGSSGSFWDSVGSLCFCSPKTGERRGEGRRGERGREEEREEKGMEGREGERREKEKRAG